MLRFFPIGVQTILTHLAVNGGTYNMDSWETFKQFVSTVSPQTVHLHGLAATGAMLTCVAIALNVGPFAKTPDVNLTIEKARSETARLALEQLALEQDVV